MALGIEVIQECVKAKGLDLAEEELVPLQQIMASIPEATRQSLKRKDDPTGRTVPLNFNIATAEDVVKLLPPRSPRFRAGQELPHRKGWQLEKLLGIGGFGEVWLARNKTVVRKVGAVKFAFDSLARDLIHESALITRLTNAAPHENIVNLEDACVEAGVDCPWLMFEYVAGGTMTDWIHKLQALPASERLNQVYSGLKQIGAGLAYCHEQSPPIVHRDLKPSNVLLDSQSKLLRITDFGIGGIASKEAIKQEQQGTMTRGGRLLTHLRGSYTGDFASPQQKRGEDPDPRDDVHALGVIGYQMMTGHLQQGAGTDFDEDLREAGANEELIGLLKDCLASKVERRIASGTVFVSRLAGSRSPIAKAAPEPKAKPAAEPLVPAMPKPAPLVAGTIAEGPHGIKFAYIPAGKFLMGSPENIGYGDEHPQHEVTISQPFWMGVTPITNAQWQAVMESKPPSNWQEPNRQVEQVDKLEFIKSLVRSKLLRCVSLRLSNTFSIHSLWIVSVQIGRHALSIPSQTRKSRSEAENSTFAS